MLQVEKKKKRPARKWMLWVALGLAAAVSGLLAMLSLREPAAPPARIVTGGTLMQHETGEIVRIRVQIRGQEPWTAERDTDGDLKIADEGGWTLDASLGERLEDALAHPVYEAVLSEDPEEYQQRLQDFGLAEPSLIAEAEYSDGKELTLRIGDSSGLEDGDFRYMTVDGDPRLYAAAESLVKDLTVERALLHPVRQPEIQSSRIDRITVRNADGEIRAEWALSGSITDADAASAWRATAPITYPADPERMSGLKKSASQFRMGMYIDEATEENMAEYGLDVPRCIVEIHLAEGTTGQITGEGVYATQEHAEETVRFTIGKARNEMTDYCLYGHTVYTINHFTASAFTDTDPLETLARDPVTVPAESLSSLEIVRADGSRDRYRLIHSAEADPGDEAGAIRCEKNGAPLAYAAFEAAYARMREVRVSGTLPEGWEKKETEVRYRFETLSGEIHTLELSAFDALHDAVTVDGCTLFYLIRDGLGELP